MTTFDHRDLGMITDEALNRVEDRTEFGDFEIRDGKVAGHYPVIPGAKPFFVDPVAMRGMTGRTTENIKGLPRIDLSKERLSVEAGRGAPRRQIFDVLKKGK